VVPPADLQIQESEAKENVLEVECASTGFFPASVPLAPLLSVLLAPLPFFDHGKNLERLRGMLEMTNVYFVC
jgi:hypothetical protein